MRNDYHILKELNKVLSNLCLFFSQSTKYLPHDMHSMQFNFFPERQQFQLNELGLQYLVTYSLAGLPVIICGIRQGLET